jgi:hypothetical protein
VPPEEEGRQTQDNHDAGGGADHDHSMSRNRGGSLGDGRRQWACASGSGRRTPAGDPS